MVQWLRLHTFTPGAMSLIPGWETKIPHGLGTAPQKRKERRPEELCLCSHKLLCTCSVTNSCSTLCNPMDPIAHQTPLSMAFPRQEYWSGLPFPPPRNLLDPGIKPASLVSPALAGGFFTAVPPRKPLHQSVLLYKGNIFKTIEKHRE